MKVLTTLLAIFVLFACANGIGRIRHKYARATPKPAVAKTNAVPRTEESCMAMYQWKSCVAEVEEPQELPVKAKCIPLNCTIDCSVGNPEDCTSGPDCELQCAGDVCNLEECPQCEPLCAEPTCPGTCEIVCDPTSCSWKIENPPKPFIACELDIIEEPSCLYVSSESAPRLGSILFFMFP
jgi:hypothetical protein